MPILLRTPVSVASIVLALACDGGLDEAPPTRSAADARPPAGAKDDDAPPEEESAKAGPESGSSLTLVRHDDAVITRPLVDAVDALFVVLSGRPRSAPEARALIRVRAEIVDHLLSLHVLAAEARARGKRISDAEVRERARSGKVMLYGRVWDWSNRTDLDDAAVEEFAARFGFTPAQFIELQRLEFLAFFQRKWATEDLSRIEAEVEERFAQLSAELRDAQGGLDDAPVPAQPSSALQSVAFYTATLCERAVRVGTIAANDSEAVRAYMHHEDESPPAGEHTGPYRTCERAGTLGGLMLAMPVR